MIAWDLAGARQLGRQFTRGAATTVPTVSEIGRYADQPVSWNFGVAPEGDTLAVGPGDRFVNLIDGAHAASSSTASA